MKYTILLLTLLASLASFAQSNTFYNPDAEPDGQIGSSDLLEFLPLFGNEFTPDTCLCGCPAGNELDFLTLADTLNSFQFAALVFQQNADSIELTIHTNSFGVGEYPFIGDTLIEYPCNTYSESIPRTCYDFDNGVITYTSYNGNQSSPYCNGAANGLKCSDYGDFFQVYWSPIGSYGANWSGNENCLFVQLTEESWAMIPEGFDEASPAPTVCGNPQGQNWDVCHRLVAFEISFIN